MLVSGPASLIMVFSISALQGQTVTQWPQETQLESLATSPPSHSTRGSSRSQSMDRVSVTCTFWQASTQRPQRMHWSGIIAVEGMAVVGLVGFGLVLVALVGDIHLLDHIVDAAVAIVILTDGTVEFVPGDDAVDTFSPGLRTSRHSCRCRGHPPP